MSIVVVQENVVLSRIQSGHFQVVFVVKPITVIVQRVYLLVENMI